MVDFPSTHWTLLRSDDADPDVRRDAWQQLATRYRAAIRSYLLRAFGARDADDHVQEFLLRSVRDDWWQRADPARGRFRGFLKLLLDRYVGHERERRALASGADPEIAPALVDDGPGPAALYDRAFAATLAERALASVAAQYARRGQAALFAALQPLLIEAGPGELRAIAASLDSSANALAAALLRLRRAHAAAMRSELASVLADPGDLDAEWRALAESLGTASSSSPTS